ncbi:UDP-N-acetylmuramoyl-tripeptide--D-alanyl-D-alanine ligase [Veronia nyctiphanis]|uniref:UDP-N-acetylmuramoyl-tripeptide--D-alanyl-D-alanine ligase n=1 Tax=Veronia nyctiphanis TaxID=1278244 RepID=A0A4Q0YTZ0_9GAMM|nr:UDP-N-acetylmuramoyl-tripeptide--D-alanyl-D-alanine ligase [Veronia nyctiphanis]RXJ72481.1 UDP-N-acetylmuramoyl-tripeptide--D-alanyl-D-alanine ligase [Veronia nyctiphanis]
MIPVSLHALTNIVSGELHGEELRGEDRTINHVSTDTRTLSSGALFVAIVGDIYDAHNFADKAIENGASALLVSRLLDADITQIVVQDTRIALGQIGAWVKSQVNPLTIGLTGSCGKTTVKEMLASILSPKGKTLFTHGNFNNDIGVPLTLLRLEEDHTFAVMELGANHVGEIAYTTALVKPDIALVTNLAAAHLEGFGSLEGVAKAKGEIFSGLSENDTAIINCDSHGGEKWQSYFKGKRLLTTSVTDLSADLHARDIVATDDGCFRFRLVSPQGECDIQLSLPGQHNVANALLAAAAALSIPGVTIDDVKQGLSHVAPVKGRGAVSFPHSGLRLIDDSYNASLAAMKAAVDLLASFDGDKVIILADMAEMGEHSKSVHRDVAEYTAESGIETVITYGPESRVISDLCNGKHFDDKGALIAHVVELMKIKKQVSVLVKGANGMKMSEVVVAIEEAAK